MKRDKKDTEFATDETIKQSNFKKPNEKDEHTKPSRPPGDVRNAKQSKSTSL